MKVGDLVKHRTDGSIGIVTRVRRHSRMKTYYTVDFIDGKWGHCPGYNLIHIKK